MSHTITRWFDIDAGHRVQRHGGKCRNLHGHRYKIGVTLQAENLTHEGFVMDFSNMKTLFGGWLDENIDHGFILSPDDNLARKAMEMIPHQKVYLLALGEEATAECLARHIYEVFKGLYEYTFKITIYETPNCMAVYP